MKHLVRVLLLAGATLTCLQALGAGIGDELPTFTLNDQAEAAHTLDDSLLRIYTTADRKGDGLMKKAMSALKQPALDVQKAIVVADISEAPGFVKRIIRSSLKDRGYTTWLDVSGSTRGLLPYRAEHVTVVELKRRRITAIRYLADTEALKQELSAAAPQNAAKTGQK